MVISNLHKASFFEKLPNKNNEFADMNVLIVNNYPIDRRIIVNTLMKIGITHVKGVADGVEAYGKLLEGDFNLLITDWNIPKMNGLELAKAIRKNNKLKNIFIFITTLRSSLKDVTKAREIGVNEYLIKPFEAETLVNRIIKINRTLKINT